MLFLLLPSSASNDPSTLVLFAYSEDTEAHKTNGLFFLKFGTRAVDSAVVFVINGPHTIGVELDKARERMGEGRFHVVLHSNTCYDFGAWSAVRGPLFQHGFGFAEGLERWTEVFTREIKDGVKLVGTTFNPWAGSSTWHLQSMALATDREGLEVAFEKFLSHDKETCLGTYEEAVFKGEIMLTQEYLRLGFSVYALSPLMEYGKINSHTSLAVVTGISPPGSPFASTSLTILTNPSNTIKHDQIQLGIRSIILFYGLITSRLTQAITVCLALYRTGFVPPLPFITDFLTEVTASNPTVTQSTWDAAFFGGLLSFFVLISGGGGGGKKKVKRKRKGKKSTVKEEGSATDPALQTIPPSSSPSKKSPNRRSQSPRGGTKRGEIETPLQKARREAKEAHQAQVERHISSRRK